MKARGLKRSFSDFKRHPWLHFISISTITIALVLLGVFFLVSRNLEFLAEKTNPQVSGTVYLKDGLMHAQVQELKGKLDRLEGVALVTFKTSNAIMLELQAFLGGNGSDVLRGSGLFPDVFEIQLKKDVPSPLVLELKGKIAKLPEVSDIDFSEDWVFHYRKVKRVISIFGSFLMIGIIVGCGFIIANFMGMRHQSRKNEIDIVRLIGGQNQFVLSPFLWEAAIEGLIGSILALTLLFVIKILLTGVLSAQWVTLLGLREWLYISPTQFLLVVAIGLVMAFLGSITVFLRFQENKGL